MALANSLRCGGHKATRNCGFGACKKYSILAPLTPRRYSAFMAIAAFLVILGTGCSIYGPYVPTVQLDSTYRGQLQQSLKSDGLAVVSIGCVRGLKVLQLEDLYLYRESLAVAGVNAARAQRGLVQHGYTPRQTNVTALCGGNFGEVQFADDINGKDTRKVQAPVFLFSASLGQKAAYQDLFKVMFRTFQETELMLQKREPISTKNHRETLQQHLGARYVLLVAGSGEATSVPFKALNIVSAVFLGVAAVGGGGVLGNVSLGGGNGPPMGQSFKTPKNLSSLALPFSEFPDNSFMHLVDLQDNYVVWSEYFTSNTCTRRGDSGCASLPVEDRSLWHSMKFLH